MAAVSLDLIVGALARDDWNLFGEMLTVTPARFSEKEPTVGRELWPRIVVLKGMFDQVCAY